MGVGCYPRIKCVKLGSGKKFCIGWFIVVHAMSVY